MPRNEDFNYTGIKASHSGGWSAGEYHSHQNAHPDKLRETSEKRQMQPRPRPDFNKPKPTTKILDLSTGKAKELEQAIKKDLEKRNIRPENRK